MANTICASPGYQRGPRHRELLQHQQAVNRAGSPVATALLPNRSAAGAQNCAQPWRLDAAQAHWWLDLLGKDERHTRIRALPHKGQSGGARKGNFAADLIAAEQWQQQGCGLYGVVNNGGDTAAEITTCTALFVEWDDRPRPEQVLLWQELGLPQPTFQVDTGGKSIHTYWVLETPVEVQPWSALMQRLISHCGSDPACKGAPRLMRLPGSHYIDRHGNSLGHVQIINATASRYSLAVFDERLPASLPVIRHSNRPPKRYLPRGNKPLQEIAEALSCIPQRIAGSNTYELYRNVLWGLMAAVVEAGQDVSVAIEMMEAHSPSHLCGWDVEQVALSGGSQINSATLFHHAKQYGWRRCDA